MRNYDISADFPYGSQYVPVLGSKIHYVEQGKGEPILFLHGNPTSSYLWRNIIPYLSAHGRCIAMDLIGMGKSDKPDIEYRFFDHVRYLEAFIERMGLRNITFVVHDWGSALAFHYAMRHENNVKAIAFMEAILAPVPGWDAFHPDFREMFQAFRTPKIGWDMIVQQNMFVEKILPSGIYRELSEIEHNYYRAPFKDLQSRKPIWRWPNEIPIAGEPADVTEAVENYSRWLQRSEIPKLLIYATPGAIINEEMVDWCKKNLKVLGTAYVGEGIHYLQEDHPHLIGAALERWYDSLERSEKQHFVA
jgi:haloalkane dehalogenase